MWEVRRVSGRVMVVGLAFDENLLRLTCGFSLQSSECFDQRD